MNNNQMISKQPFEPPSGSPVQHFADRGSPSRPNRNVSPLNPKKIKNLQLEFQNLKQKIKEVEYRNSEMLTKIKSKISKNNEDDEVIGEIENLKSNLNYKMPSTGKPKRFLSELEHIERSISPINKEKEFQDKRNERKERINPHNSSSEQHLQKVERARHSHNNNQNLIVESSPMTNRFTYRSNSINDNLMSQQEGRRPENYRKERMSLNDEIDESAEEAAEVEHRIKNNGKIGENQNRDLSQNHEQRIWYEKSIRKAKLEIRTNISSFEDIIGESFSEILKSIEILNQKILSLDLETEELKQIFKTGKRKSNESVEFERIKSRQSNFIVNELESKLRKLTLENERIEKQLIDKNLEIEQLNEERKNMREILVEIKEEKTGIESKNEELLKALKKKDKEIEEKVKELNIKHEEELKRIGEGNEKLLKSFGGSQKPEHEEQMLFSFHNRNSIRQSDRTPESIQNQEVVEQFESKIEKLENEIKQYENLIEKKNDEISKLNAKVYESELMSGSVKKMLEELMKDHEKTQNLTAKKDVEYMESIMKINQNNKKKSKEFEETKKRIMTDLRNLCDKKVIRKIKKECESEFEKKLDVQAESGNPASDEFMIAGVTNLLNQLSLTIDYYQGQEQEMDSQLEKLFNVSKIEIEMSGKTNVLSKIAEEEQRLKNKLKEAEDNKAELQKEIRITRNSLLNEDKPNILDKVNEGAEPPNGLNKKKPSNSDKQNKEREGMKERIKLLQQSFDRELGYKNNQINDLKMKLESFDEKHYESTHKFSEEIANVSNNLKLKEKQYDDLIQEKSLIEEEKKYFEEKCIELSERLKVQKISSEGTNKESFEKSMGNMKEVQDFKNKIKDYEKTNSNLMSKNKKLQEMIEETEKSCKERLLVKTKAIDELLEGKKNLSIELKILNERMNNIKPLKEISEEKRKSLEHDGIMNLESKIKIKEYSDDEFEKLKAEFQEIENRNIELELLRLNQAKIIQEMEHKINTIDEKEKILERQKMEESTEAKKSLIREKEKRETLEKQLEVLKESAKNDVKKHGKELKERKDEIDTLKQTVETYKKAEEALKQTIKQNEIKEQELLKLLQKMEQELSEHEQEKEKEIGFLEEKHSQEYKKIEKELKIYIEKYNNSKVELMDQLDGKSDFARGMQIDLETTVSLLKEENELLSKQLEESKKEVDKVNHLLKSANIKIEEKLKENEELVKLVPKASFNTENETKESIISKYEEILEKKESELKMYIEKYNDAKVELMDQLDGKSDMARDVQFGLETKLSTFREQIEALENRLRGAEEELHLQITQRSRTEKELEKIKEKLVQKSKEAEKLYQDIFELNTKLQEFQESQDENLLSENSYKSKKERKPISESELTEAYEQQIKEKTNEINRYEEEIKKYQQTVQTKDNELIVYIEKYNALKMKVTNQLDDKSDAMHNAKDNFEAALENEKEKVLIMEKQLEDYKQEIIHYQNQNQELAIQLQNLQQQYANHQEESDFNQSHHQSHEENILNEMNIKITNPNHEEDDNEEIDIEEVGDGGMLGENMLEDNMLEDNIYDVDDVDSQYEGHENEIEATQQNGNMLGLDAIMIDNSSNVEDLRSETSQYRPSQHIPESLPHSQVEIEELQAQFETLLEQKEKELQDYIKKYNDVKIQLVDEMDGKSDMYRDVKGELEGRLAMLIEQNELQAQKIKEFEDKNWEEKEKLVEEIGQYKKEVQKLEEAILTVQEHNKKISDLLKEKDHEILTVIEKCNKEKLELVEQMDGKSSINRVSLIENENVIRVLKEHVNMLEQNEKEQTQKIREERIRTEEEKEQLKTQILRMLAENNELKIQNDEHNKANQKDGIIQQLHGPSEAIGNIKLDQQDEVLALRQQIALLESQLQSQLSSVAPLQELESSPSEKLVPLSAYSDNFEIVDEEELIHSPLKSKASHSEIEAPSNSIPFNSEIFQEYLCRLKTEILLQLQSDQTFFCEEFLSQHSPECVTILEELLQSIISITHNNKNKEFLDELAFIDKNDFDFCESVSQDGIDQVIESLTTQEQESNAENNKNQEGQVLEYESEAFKEAIQKNDELTEEIKLIKMENDNLKKEIQTIVEERENDEEYNERQHMNQSEIYKKEILKEKQRADTLTSNLESLKKTSDRMLEIVFSDEVLVEDLEDCFEHYQNINNIQDEKSEKLFEGYLVKYEQIKNSMENSKWKSKEKEGSRGKSKRKWF